MAKKTAPPAALETTVFPYRFYAGLRSSLFIY